MDYPPWTSYLDIVQPHKRHSDTMLHTWTLGDVLRWYLDQNPPCIVIQNAMHSSHPGGTAMAVVDNNEGKTCTWILESPSNPQQKM